MMMDQKKGVEQSGSKKKDLKKIGETDSIK